MNYRFIWNTIGNIMKMEAGLLVLPLIVSFLYRENTYIAFLIPMVLLFGIGFLLSMKKAKNQTIFAKEGLVLVGLSWIVISLFGSLPFLISQEIPNIVNAFFETVSGFTTTGASILNNVEALSKGMLFWRSLTHWIGGMGILVFVLALIPQTNGRSIYVLKAESPGPQVGKIVSKVKHTARILYSIYIALTLIQIILLSFRIPLFDSITHSFATAGTGGFSILNQSVGGYNSVYVEMVITVFMLLFGTNFTLFYFLLIGNVKKIWHNEEFRWYLGIVFVSIVIITLNTLKLYDNFFDTLRHSSFQVASIITTTGFSTVDFNTWPSLSKIILVLLMFIGASAGSTGGGMKVSRIILYTKSLFKEIRFSVKPREISAIKFDKKSVEPAVMEGLVGYLMAYLAIVIVGVLVLSIEDHDLVSNFTAIIATFNNVGPGLNIVGPVGNYSIFSNLSKLTLSFIMLAGRLEIFPILILFSPITWKKN